MSSKINEAIATVLRALETDGQDSAAVVAVAASTRPKSRVGKKTVAGHFDPLVAWQLKKLAVDQDTTVQKLLDEALGDLFEKYHLPRC